jgi:hypothetical protein
MKVFPIFRTIDVRVLQRFKTYYILLKLVVKYGRFKHSKNDFSSLRSRTLEKLQEFIPQKKYQARFSLYNRNSLLTNNAIVKRIAGEAAFVKKSFFPGANHLHNSFHNISYIRIPKSASTSMSWTMLFSIYPNMKDYSLSTTEINYLTDVNLQTKLKEKTNEIFFTVLRNPFARLVSVYRDFFENKAHESIMKDYLFSVLPNTLSFSEFVERIAIIPRHLQEPHFKPQSLFVDYYEKHGHNVVILKVDKPGEVESFLSIYGLKLPFLNASESSYDYRTYFTQKTFESVSELYSEDIRRFNFSIEVNDLKNFLIKNEQN